MIFYRAIFDCEGREMYVDMMLDPSVVGDIMTANVSYMLRHAIRAKKVSENLYNKPHHVLRTELSIDRQTWFLIDMPSVGE